jgi:hypothetical protein
MKTRWNPWNRLYAFNAWFLVACAAGGTYLAHDRNMAFVALVVNTLILHAVLSGSDREPVLSETP